MLIQRLITPPLEREKNIAPLVAAGLIAGGAGVVGSLLNSKSSSDANEQSQRNQELAFEQQKILNNIEYERNISLLTNQYKYQLAGLRSAGLSPNLLGSISSGVSASASAGSAPSPAPVIPTQYNIGDLTGAMQTVANIKNTEADTKLKESQVKNTEQDTLVKQAQAFNIETLTPEQKRKLIYEANLLDREAKKVDVDIDFTNKAIQELDSRIKLNDANSMLINETTPYVIKQYEAGIAELWAHKRLDDAQAAVAYANVPVLTAQANYIQALTYLSEEQKKLVKEEIFNAQLQGNSLSYAVSTMRNISPSERARLEKDLLEAQITNQQVTPWTNIAGSVMQGVGTAAGLYFGAKGLKGVGSGSYVNNIPSGTTFSR